MKGGELQAVEDVSAATDEKLLALSTDVMGELMDRAARNTDTKGVQTMVARVDWSPSIMRPSSRSIGLCTTR